MRCLAYKSSTKIQVNEEARASLTIVLSQLHSAIVDVKTVLLLQARDADAGLQDCPEVQDGVQRN